MASGPFRNHPTSLDTLPPELRCTLTQYVGGKDLGNMRFLSGFWNTTAKETLRKRNRLIFNFDKLEKLIRFNDVFAAYTPTKDIAAGKFCFTFTALDTAAAKEHLDTFVQRFGHLVTSLHVNLFKPLTLILSEEQRRQQESIDSRRIDTVLGHVTFLLQKVKGQVQALELLHYAYLEPEVVGHGPFPRLRTLKLGTRRFPVTAGEQACVLFLSRKVPAIQRFEFQAFHRSTNGDPLFLAILLWNLGQGNGQVEVKLDMLLEFAGGVEDRALLQELATVSVRIVELNVAVYDDLDMLRMVLSWIGAQSDWLKKLTLKVKFRQENAALEGLRVPRLRALEELNYVQETVESVLKYAAADYPSLRKVTTASTGNDFTVALPQVTDLTVYRSRFTELVPREQGIYGAAAFQLPPFRNVETLTCSVKFIDLGSIVQLQNLRRLTIKSDYESRNLFSFWKRVTHGARKLTLRQIQALPEPFEDEVRARVEPCFSDVTNLKEFKIDVCQGYITTVNLDALLYLSRTKRLQRLERMEFHRIDSAASIPDVYLTDLRNYHNLVVMS